MLAFVFEDEDENEIRMRVSGWPHLHRGFSPVNQEEMEEKPFQRFCVTGKPLKRLAWNRFSFHHRAG